jgi:hypothetical protein
VALSLYTIPVVAAVPFSVRVPVHVRVPGGLQPFLLPLDSGVLLRYIDLSFRCDAASNKLKYHPYLHLLSLAHSLVVGAVLYAEHFMSPVSNT